ncbi:hypothetical protein OIU84_027065 [Salix udensis]|uniref:Uncharacterized protein n=1 Tax=Salix udensis TaxID=889485 RepID=A0AAD6PAG1_9ROSI|nr:hypothetical protein OIU84_027065 [Salix udensis]
MQIHPAQTHALSQPFTRCSSNLTPYFLKIKSFSSSSLEFSPWSGLQSWRESPLNKNRFWGPNGPQTPPSSIDTNGTSLLDSASSLAELGALVLSTSDPLLKSKLSHLAFSKWRNEKLPIGVYDPPSRPARPPKPELVSPKEIPAPKDSGMPLNAYMLHNLAHVELNAIDLAWDTVVRDSTSWVSGQLIRSSDYYCFFIVVPSSINFLVIRYGDMPAHNLLWRECEKSSDDVAARLAVIPLVQEARGLDAGPRLVQKLVGFGDNKTSKIVARIADEEVAHVAVGVYWFVSVCQKMGRAPCSTFKDLLREDEAGIPRDWYDNSSTNKHGEVTKPDTTEKLSMIYGRLASIIAMENENASLNKPAE